MNSDYHIFEIPVYRLTREAFDSETDRVEVKTIKNYNLDLNPDPDVKFLVLKKYHYSYAYNDVVGWIQIFIDGIYIRGEYYFIRSGNVRRGFNKDYKYIGKAFELWLSPKDTTDEIFLQLIERINSLRNDGLFKNRLIDTERLENIGKYVDWAKIIKDNSK